MFSQIATSVTIINSGLIGYNGISLTNFDSFLMPDIAAGSSIEIAGAYFKASSAVTPIASSWTAITTGSTAFISLTPSGTAGSQILTANWTANSPEWNQLKQGWYTSATSAIRVAASVLKTGTSTCGLKNILSSHQTDITKLKESVNAEIGRTVFADGYAHSRLHGPQNHRGIPGTNLRKVGPIITINNLPATLDGLDRRFVESPCVVFDDGIHKYRMVFTAGFGTGTASITESIYTCLSDDGVVWTTPTLLKQGDKTAHEHFTGPVLYYDVSNGISTTYLFYIKLFTDGYEGNGGSPRPEIWRCVVDANYNSSSTSGDTKVLAGTGSTWMADCVWHPNLIKYKNVYYMFFNASDSYGKESILLAYSSTITGTFTVYTNPIRTYIDEAAATGVQVSNVGDPSVYFEDGYWYMAYYYVNVDNGLAYDNMLMCNDLEFPMNAGGVDGANPWSRYGTGAILVPGPLDQDYDSQYAHKPWILQRNGIHHHYYTAVRKLADTANGTFFRSIALAVDSVPGVGWSAIQSETGNNDTANTVISSNSVAYYTLIKPVTVHFDYCATLEVLCGNADWVATPTPTAIMMLNPGRYRLTPTTAQTCLMHIVGAYGTDRLSQIGWNDTWPG